MIGVRLSKIDPDGDEIDAGGSEVQNDDKQGDEKNEEIPSSYGSTASTPPISSPNKKGAKVVYV